MIKNSVLILLSASVLISSTLMAEDSRRKVDLPPMMQDHMKTNMRDHLLAIQQITDHLSKQQYEEASDVAENRLGMSSTGKHDAPKMGKLMPPEMRALGQAMHRSASQFARIAKDAELDGGLEKAFGALSEVMQRCVSCHAVFRTQ